MTQKINHQNSESAKNKSTTHFKCKVFGHQWEGDSLRRTCTRCGKVQVARYVGNDWVDAAD